MLWLAQAATSSIIVLAVINAGYAIAGPIYNAVIVGYRLGLIPDELQGRVNSVIRLIAFSLAPLGAFVTGVILQRTSAIPAILAFGGLYILAALATTLNGRVRRA